MKNSADDINKRESNLPTSLLIPKTSPLAKIKFLLAITDIIIPDTIAPKTPQRPTQPPIKYEINPTITVEAK